MGSLADLISPTINFLLFLGILYWLLRNGVKRHFANVQNDVTALYQRAQDRQREADAKWAECQQKLDNLPQETAEIMQQAEHSADRFAKEYQQETQEKIAKLQRESQVRLQAEQAASIGQLNRELLEAVLAKTKDTFKRDTSLRTKATKKLIEDVVP